LEVVLKILNPMTSTIFWSIIVFAILIVVIWKFVAKPVNNLLTRRQNEIQESVNSAEKQKEEAEKYLEEQKKLVDEAKKEARNIIEESKDAAKRLKDEIEEKAGEKSRALLETAQEEIKAERERSVVAVKDQIVTLALDTTQKIIGKSLSEEEHKKLIEESLKETRKM
jgi:F-type H+-transporting ATPase subunit b